jgi:hypothetical protein
MTSSKANAPQLFKLRAAFAMNQLRHFARVVNNEAAMERLGASIASLSLAGDAILLCGCVLATCVRPM